MGAAWTVGDKPNKAANSCGRCEPVFWNEFNNVTQCHCCGRVVTGAVADAVVDASGRVIAPPQAHLADRPSGPWDGNGKV